MTFPDPESRFLAAEQATEPLLVADAERIHYANQAFADLVGIPRDQIEGKAVDQVATIIEEPLVVDRLRNAMRQGQPFRGEASCFTASGEPIPIDLAVFPVPRGDTMLYVVAAADLRREKALEHKLRHSQRLDAVTHLADGIAHEMNNVIHVLSGYASLLKNPMPGAGPSQIELADIEAAARRGDALLRDLLDFARRRPVVRAATDLNEIVDRWRELLRILVGPEIHLMVDLDPTVPPVHGERGEIQHILINLTSNARAAMPDGGTLTITTKSVHPEQPILQEAQDERVGEYVVLTVTDTGVGMSPETRAHAFDGYGGGGLGLATVQGIVRESGGLVWIRSQPNDGTTVEVHFQALRGAITDGERRSGPFPAPRRGSETVLLVDDDPLVLRVAKRGLEQFGYRVLAAQSAREATAIAAERGAQIAVLVADVMMPGQGGAGLAAELRADWPHLRVLFISGHPEAEGRPIDGALRLYKPFSPDELAAAIRELLTAAAV